MPEDLSTQRPLFGGAIVSSFPLRFQDVSNIRQVPEHQEVFVDPTRDESLIFELLDLKTDVADHGSATWFLQDLANEQDAEGNEQDAEGTMDYENQSVLLCNAITFNVFCLVEHNTVIKESFCRYQNFRFIKKVRAMNGLKTNYYIQNKFISSCYLLVCWIFVVFNICTICIVDKLKILSFIDNNCISLFYKKEVLEQSGVFEADGLRFRSSPAVITTAVGQMAISKGRQGRDAQNIVKVYLANLRLKDVATDVLITAYEPVLINPLSETAATVGAGLAVPAAQSGCMPMEEVFRSAVASFKVNDWSLLGAVA